MCGQLGVFPVEQSIPTSLNWLNGGVAIYGINYKDEDAAALAWLDELGDPYLASIADHDGTLGLDLGVYGAPETYLVDANGLVRYRHVGVVNERVWSNVLQPIYEQLKNGKAN